MSNYITAQGHEGDPNYGRDYEFNGGSLPTQYEWLRICQDAERYAIERHEDWPYKTEGDAADDADLRIYIGMYTDDEIPSTSTCKSPSLGTSERTTSTSKTWADGTTRRRSRHTTCSSTFPFGRSDAQSAFGVGRPDYGDVVAPSEAVSVTPSRRLPRRTTRPHAPTTRSFHPSRNR